MRKFRGEFPGILYRKKLFHFAANFACVEVRVASRDTKMAAELILMLDEPLAANEEEMLIDSGDEEEICVIAATSIFMRRDLNRNSGFCDVIVPTSSIDEFNVPVKSKLQHPPHPRAFEFLENFCPNSPLTGRKAVQMPPPPGK